MISPADNPSPSPQRPPHAPSRHPHKAASPVPQAKPTAHPRPPSSSPDPHPLQHRPPDRQYIFGKFQPQDPAHIYNEEHNASGKHPHIPVNIRKQRLADKEPGQPEQNGKQRFESKRLHAEF